MGWTQGAKNLLDLRLVFLRVIMSQIHRITAAHRAVKLYNLKCLKIHYKKFCNLLFFVCTSSTVYCIDEFNLKILI